MGTDDRDLIRRLRSDDQQALSELLGHHWRGVVRYAFGLLGDWDAAEDVAQGTFARLWEGRARWSDVSSVALLYRIARNGALDVSRRAARRAGPGLLDEIPARDRTEIDVELRELEAAVAEAVARLPPRRQEVFRLARENGFSYDEIAEVTQLSRQTVANHMTLALADLRVLLRHFLALREDRHLEAPGEAPRGRSERTR